MNQKLVPLALILLLLVSLLPNPIAPAGLASADEVWTPVGSAAELDAMRTNLAGSYRLTQDIDLTGFDNGDHKGWVPVGGVMSPFTGKFDGNGFSIRNMTIDRPDDNNVGLFGSTRNATLLNVKLVNMTVNGHSYVGGIAGELTTSTLTNSFAQGAVTVNDHAGVLVGYNSVSTITDSHAEGQIHLGPSGSITPQESIGGLVGYNTGTISRTYSTAAVASGSFSGGLVGRQAGMTPVGSSYWNTETSGTSASGGGIGRTTAEMKRKATYAGWNFDTVWGLIEGSTYPLLRGDYTKVALASLTVKDANDDTALSLDRAFSGDYGDYSVQVVNKTDRITVAGTALSGTSTVTVNGGAASETIALNTGKNDIQIRVSEPGGLSAVYRLTVYRGAGTAQYPHRIATADQLSRIGQPSEGYNLSDSYRLEADIDLSAFSAGAGWTPIGSGLSPFRGTFDGNGHTIANLTLDRPGDDGVGLFGATNGATVSNVALLNARIAGRDQAGGLIGYANDTAVSAVSVQGAVYGGSMVGGLIGHLDSPSSSVSESYSAAYVSGSAMTGGLIGENASSNVSNSFWDTESSGRSTSAGGTGKTTSEMMSKATYTAAGWSFGSGQRWGIIEGTTYPIPYSSLGGVLLAGLTVTAPGAAVTTDRSYDAAQGVYAATLSTPVATATVTAVPAAGGATATLNGAAGGTIPLGLGQTPVEIRVTAPNGIWQGVYRLTIVVPTPQPQSVQVPANGIYGIGRELDFTVTYSHPVDVAGSPSLPLRLGAGAGAADAAAVYGGQPAGQPAKLNFRYTVQAGDIDSDGISLGGALTATAPAAVTAIGGAASLELPGTLPDLSGIRIDGLVPTIALTRSATAPTNAPVTISATADGTGGGVVSLKWAVGTHAASYFASAGTVLTGGAFQAAENGIYSVYAEDEAGNAAVETIAIANIVSRNPTLALDYTPRGPINSGVEVSVTASVYEEGAGNALAALRWAPGLRTAGDFADPAFGTAVPETGSFHVGENGTYTVYAADLAGNTKVETLTIGHIVKEPPALVLDYYPKGTGQSGVDITVTASVYGGDIGNVLTALRWAAGRLGADDFADPSFGQAVPGSGSVRVARNGPYTFYAADTAGNVRVETIDISNLYTPPEPDSDSASDTPPPAGPSEGQSFSLVPGKAYTLTFEGMTLYIPVGAITQPTTIRMKKAAAEAQRLLRPGQSLLSGAFELTKDVAGTFKLPVKLGVEWSGKTLSDDQRPALFYYDETAKRWVELPGKREGDLITGETDHFTLFAVMSAAAEDGPKPDPKPDPMPTLSDLTGHWAEREIREAVAKGWVEGYADGTFQPERPVSRAEFALLLDRITSWPAGGELPFDDRADIPGWAAEAIARAVRAGVMNGYPDRTFRPDAGILRAETAVLIARAAGLSAGEAAAHPPFADDADIASWARGEVEAARAAKLIQGQADNRFNPLATTTRAEAVILLQRLAAHLELDR
ncbi:S-layer homology domain-containing protein [Paenibacillus flagellatus]|uniref:SLH domain-containing protein n=1 Tax=Paenibacillus flagellatus TaxID=2211139 RepID=A0A2V5K628_9BACL|nr:S-layer homology domain-containing protein [Paenibacillus flagellatus]PYI53364.1 hypothetical protein DLM86_16395 [Paenibacillus flagellatus]